MVGPILAALTVLGLLAGVGWYVTRDTTSPTSQNTPITTTTDDASVTPTDDVSTPVETPSATPSKTPSATPSKTPSKTPTATPSRSTTPPSRRGHPVAEADEEADPHPHTRAEHQAAGDRAVARRHRCCN